MSDQKIDGGKRTWIIASSCAGAVGAGFVAVPFVSSFEPSERARAAGAPVEADISALKPGEKMTVEWRGKPVWIVRRTPEQLAELPKLDSQLADPKSQRNPDEFTPPYRAQRGPLDQARVPGRRRHLHPPRLLARRQVHARARSPRCPTTGRAASSARATARPSTWPAASSRTSRRPTTSRAAVHVPVRQPDPHRRRQEVPDPAVPRISWSTMNG